MRYLYVKFYLTTIFFFHISSPELTSNRSKTQKLHSLKISNATGDSTKTFKIIKQSKKYDKRPLYVFGHMANSIESVIEYLEDGANAIECDVQFHKDGRPKEIKHGRPCDTDFIFDCDRREEIEVYFNFMRNLSQRGNVYYNENMTILMLDLKTSSLSDGAKKTAGTELARALLQTIFREEKEKKGYEPIYITFSQQSAKDLPFIQGAMLVLNEPEAKKFHKYIGWDLGFAGDPSKISEMWRKGKVGSNIWQGDGVTTVFYWFYWQFLFGRLLTALNNRNSRGDIKKVYTWTLIWKRLHRDVLRYGVDGILSNQVHELIEVMNEPEFKPNFRKATKSDYPWTQIPDEIEYDTSELEDIRTKTNPWMEPMLMKDQS